MIPGPQQIGAVQLFAGLVALAFLKPGIDNVDTPGSKGYSVFTVGVSLWMFGLAVPKFTAEYTVFVGSYHVLVLGTELAAAGVLLLALAFSGRTSLVRRTAILAGGGIVLMQVLLWTNSVHHLMYEPGPGVLENGIVSDRETATVATSGWWWVHTGASYLCAIAGEVILLWGTITSKGIRRKQFFWLSLLAVPILPASIVSTFGLFDLPYNVSSIGFLLAVPILAVAMFRTAFLDIVPIARRTAMSEIDAAVVTIDRRNRVLDANERARELFDWESEYVGVSAGEFFESVPDEVVSQFTGRDDGAAEVSLMTDGQRRHYSVSVSPVGDRTEQGRVVLLHDITAQKRREAELEELNTRFQLTLDETDTGIWDWDLETDDVHWDEATERLFGYEPGEFPGTFEAIAEHVHHDDIPAVRSAMDRSLETGEEYQAEFRVEPPDGCQRWIQTRGVVETDGSGTPTRMLGIQTDITDWKEREGDLAAARESAETIIEASPAPIWVQGVEEIHYANNAAAELFGFDDPDALVGSSALSYVPEGQRERARDRNREMLDSDERLPETTGTLITVDGDTREALFAAAPIQYHGDRSIVTIANDITERKRYERQVEEQRNNLEILNQVVRHDIRNELQVVSGHLEQLRTTVTDEDEEGVEQALAATSNAIDITTTAREVTEVMLQSNVDQGAVRLHSVLETELENVRSNYDQARFDLDNAGPEVEVVADDMLASVFRNLMTNAIQHNDAEVPEVTVTVSTDDGTAVVRVGDNGPGIPDGRKREIFEQGEMGLDSEGTGLGLYLVDTLVAGYGGEVRVEDSPAGGAIFVVELPVVDSG